MLRAHGIEQRQVLITGFPFKANEDGAKRFFERCGKINNVKMLPWAKTGKPSGRFVIEFEELEGAQAALEMHKKKMGPRDIGVFRINVGDSEETMTVPRAMVAAILGPQGAFLKGMEAESRARIFVRYDPSQLESNKAYSGDDGRGRIVILKGTPKEREAAKRLIVEATQDGFPILPSPGNTDFL
jgi:RNA recognition motif-containing protein